MGRATLRTLSMRHALVIGGLAILLLGSATMSGNWALAQADCATTLSPNESIQAAIDEAESEAVLCLKAGEWTENLTIDKSLSLRGTSSERSIIRAREERRPVVQVYSSEKIDVEIANLMITGAKGFLGYGMLVRGSSQVTINYSSFTENDKSGLLLGDSAQITINESTISANREMGIALIGSSHAMITNSTISNNERTGISLGSSVQATIRENVIKGNGAYGLSSSSNDVRGGQNEIHGNGIDLGGNIPGTLREPLVEATEDEITYPDKRYPTLQHAADALRPGGKLIFQSGAYTAGVTLAKELSITAQETAEVRLQARNSSVPALSLVGEAKLTATKLTVTGGGTGFSLTAEAQATIKESTIYENSTGVHLKDFAKSRFTIAPSPITRKMAFCWRDQPTLRSATT